MLLIIEKDLIMRIKAFIKKILSNIFSVCFEYKHIRICILGISLSIKIRNRNLINKNLNFKFLKYQKKYKTLLKRLPKEIKNRKLKVFFHVTETAKWNAQSLYDKLEKSNIFEPYIFVSKVEGNNYGLSFKHNLEYFQNIAQNVIIGFDEENNKSIDIKQFSPDIVFYQQPWGLWENQKPQYVSDFALTYHFSYAIGDAASCVEENFFLFYNILYKYFIFANEDKQLYSQYLNYELRNVSAVGHPKLDVYKDYQEENYEHKYVIYAPHHSFEPNSLHYATFEWSGKFILEWAKAHPEFEWVFKPHPRFKEAAIKNNIMTKDEVEEYYSEWEKIGKSYFDGSYFDLLKSSKCLITDCGAFLLEYLPTKQPVIHMRNPLGTDYIESIKVAMNSYYDVWNPKELENSMNEILIEGRDNKKTDRLNVIKQLNLDEYSSTEKIINELKKDMEINNIL